MTMLDLPFDLIELVPCPASIQDGPGLPLSEVAYREDAWLPEEIDSLRAWFGDDEDLGEVAVRLDRTLVAVQTKVAELGLRRNSSRPWTEMDAAYLVEHYGTDATSVIASVLGRSAGAIYAHAGLLELTGATEPDWTAWETAQVRAGYQQSVPVAQLGVLIGRTSAAIATLASKLEIKHANAPPDWSAAEQQRALELAGEGHRYVVIAERLRAEGHPQRSGRTVGQTLRRLGYARGWGRSWLAEEDDLLRGAYAHGKSLTPLRTRLGRSKTSIAYRAGELDLQGTHARPNGWRTDPPWTEADIAILRRDYGTVPTPELAARLGRKKAGVYNKAHALRLVHGFMQAFSDEEERAMRIAWRHGTSITDLGKALDRDVAVVSKHAIRIRIPFSARTNKAPRGPRRGRPAVTLASLLAIGDAADGTTRTG